MVTTNNNPVTPDIRELRSQQAQTSKFLSQLRAEFQKQNQTIQGLLNTRANTPAAPVGNQLWNGEIGHSVNSWHDSSYVTTDKADEAAWWFSHNKPATLHTFVDADVDIFVDDITIVGHGYTTGQTVDLFNTGGALPIPFAVATTYFVIVLDVDTIQLASSVANAFAGTEILITSAAGGGTHTIQEKLVSTDARTSATSNTLKKTDHTTYDARYSRWSGTNGWAELTGTMGVEQIMPANFVDATTPLARVSLIAAKKSSFIEIPDDCLMGCGIWDNTSAQRKFLEGDLGFTAEVVGTPAATVERRYRILTTSDRGYSILSPEITLAAAPRDGSFTSTVNVSIGWRQQAGQLQVDIYEYLPNGGDGVSAAQYRLVTQISAATSFIHQGDFLEVVAGYPTSTSVVRNATFFTEEDELPALATNGVSSSWDTINFPIGVPNNYNKANTTDRQWLRIWLTVALNLYIEGCTTDGSTTITIPTGAVDSSALASGGYGTGAGSLYAGLVAEVYDSSDALITTTTISSVTSDTALVLGTSVAAGSDRKLRIVAGGFHGIYLDKIHLGFQQNTSYSPNPLDVRVLQPVAAPTSSTQGTVGTGGSGGGIETCIAFDMPVKLASGEWVEVGTQTDKLGVLWAAAGLRPNALVKLRPGISRVRWVVAKNGVWLRATDTERFTVAPNDFDGTPLYRLRVGDPIMTEIDDRIEQSTIKWISPYLPEETVFTPSLTTNNLFIAGFMRLSWWKRLWNRIAHRRQVKGGFILHNAKPLPE